ncbi:MAG TPA: S9 family peptidase [Chloroflexota bacterium]|nr:S9 family peptidase [Chloroflexota bacterium]
MAFRSFAQYLNVRQAYGASFAPDGHSLAFLTDITGTPQVWTVDAPGRWPQQRTFGGERVAGVSYAPAGDRLLYSMDVGGNERMQLLLQEEAGTREIALTDAPQVFHTFGDWSRDGRRIAYASNARDAAYFDVYVQEAREGARAERIYTHDGTNYAVNWSPDDRLLLVERFLTLLEHQLLLVDLADGAVRAITDPAQPARYLAPRWAADGRTLFVLSDRGRDTVALAGIDVASGELRWLRTGDWDYQLLEVSHDGRRLALVENVEGYGVLHLLDAETLQPIAAPELPRGVILDLAWHPDGEQLACTISGAAGNADIWLCSVEEGALVQVTHSARGGIPASSFVAPALVHFSTFDGRQVPAFYYRPAGETRDLPTVVYVHGGPESQFVPAFNGVIQYLLHRGYAVLAPNVRGSTGYGTAYTHLDDVRLRMDSVADLQHAVFWLREHGAQPGRIAVMGGSYGGFMTLAAITTYPDLWAAAVDIVGVANFVTFLENTSSWRRALREAEYGSLEHDREFLASISPIHHVERIIAPLLVIHGANDPRVPVGEAEQIVESLRGRDRAVEYLRFEDEGHGLVKLPNRIRAYTAVAAFLDRYLLEDSAPSV